MIVIYSRNVEVLFIFSPEIFTHFHYLSSFKVNNPGVVSYPTYRLSYVASKCVNLACPEPLGKLCVRDCDDKCGHHGDDERCMHGESLEVEVTINP